MKDRPTFKKLNLGHFYFPLFTYPVLILAVLPGGEHQPHNVQQQEHPNNGDNGGVVGDVGELGPHRGEVDQVRRGDEG